MKLIFILLTLLIFPYVADADNLSAGSSSSAIPLAVIIEREPMQFIANTESPNFVLYNDGTIIYLDTNQIENLSYRTLTLDSIAFKKLSQSLCPNSELLSLKEYYALADYYDAPGVDIYISDGHISKTISLYGAAIKNGSMHTANNEESIPKDVIRIYKLINKISKEKSTVWHPDYIEIIIWPIKNPVLKSSPWPNSWPSINDTLSKKRDNSSYSLFLPFSKKPELDRYFDNLKNRQPILLENKNWGIMGKPAFPNEAIWNQSFKENRKDRCQSLGDLPGRP